jgi:hypothetical protein
VFVISLTVNGINCSFSYVTAESSVDAVDDNAITI